MISQMGQRFIKSGLWESDKFLEIPTENKLLTIYVICEASNIGIFSQSLNLAGFKLGFKVTKEMILSLSVDIEELSPGRYWLPKFCQHQYGSLKESSPPHRSYINELKKEGLLERVAVGYAKGIDTPKDKTGLEKDKTGLDILCLEENKEKSIEEDFELLWSITPRMGRARSGKEKVLKAFHNLKAPKPSIEQLVSAMELWVQSPDWIKENGQFVPGLHVWLKDRKFEIDIDQPVFDWAKANAESRQSASRAVRMIEEAK